MDYKEMIRDLTKDDPFAVTKLEIYYELAQVIDEEGFTESVMDTLVGLLHDCYMNTKLADVTAANVATASLRLAGEGTSLKMQMDMEPRTLLALIEYTLTKY